MLSNIFARLRTSLRPIQNYQQQYLLRLLSTTDSIAQEKSSTERETGIVKRFSKEKGYGFISKSSDGTDCFVHFKNINATGFKTLEEGQEVEFTLVQGEKGIEAKDVNILSLGTNRSSFMSGSSANNSTSSRFGGGGGSKRQSPFQFGGTRSSELDSDENQDSEPTEKKFNFRSGLNSSTTDNLFSSRQTQTNQSREVGSVKRWTGEQGFGFIRPSNGGPDLFCHVRSLKNGLQALEEGQTVQYRIQKTNKGEEARDVSIFNEGDEEEETSSPVDPGQRQTGTVRRWLGEKGYGFLRLDAGGSDVFVHLRDLGDGMTSLEEGQVVEFDMKNNEKGQTAHNVTVRNEP